MITHTHHIIPKHAGGSDDPSNLIELTVEEHALAHKRLWEEHGRWQDYLAWQSLSGQISGEEARRLAVSYALKGKPKSAEHRKKMSESRKRHAKLHGGPTLGKKLGKRDETQRKNHSEGIKKFLANGGKPSRLGAKLSEETKQKMRLAALLREKKKREALQAEKSSKETEPI